MNRLKLVLKSSTPSRESIRAVALALLMITSVFAMSGAFGGSVGVASAEESDDENYEDFEDGNHDGWVSEGPGSIEVVPDSFWGDNSLEITDQGDHDHAFWLDGPEIDTHDNFEISGTFKASETTGEASYRFGISEHDEDFDFTTNLGESEADRALVVVDNEIEEIYLSTDWTEDDPGETIDASYDTWLQYRLQFDGGTANLKVWEAGTAEPADWQISREYTQFDGYFYGNAGVADNGRVLNLDRVDLGGNTISGKVVDQDGNPVPNATVEAYGVDFEAIDDGQIDDLPAEADNLLDDAENPFPNAWDPDFDVSEFSSEWDTRNYVLAHNQRDWSHSGSTTIFSDTIDEPRIQLDPDDRHVLSVWDPEDENLVLPQNPMDNSFHGAIDGDDAVVIEQISPTGETVDSWTAEPDTTYVAERQWPASDIERDVVRTSLPEGHFYRIYPESNEAASYVVVVGDPEDIRNQLVHDLETQADELEDQADQLTEYSQNLRDQMESGEFARTTVTTDENGTFSINMPRTVERASVQAYRADGTILTDITGASISDLRELDDRGYNGSVYLTHAPERTDVPTEDMELTVQKYDSPPFGDVEGISELLERMDELEDMMDYEELEQIFQDNLHDLDREELEELAEELNELAEQNDQLEQLIEDIEGQTDEELVEAINELEAEIGALEDYIEEIESGSDVGDDAASAFARFAGEYDEDNIQVIGHWSDGTSFTVPDEYVSVSSSFTIIGEPSTEVSVDDYPIDEDDPASLRFEFRVVGEDGVGEGTERITNPGFDGVIPELDSISSTHMNPSTGETTTIRVNSDDPAYSETTDVQVWGPDGQTVDATEREDGDGFQVTPENEGLHHVQVTYQDTTGETFVETFRLRAMDEQMGDTATIRATEGTGGPYAIVGSGLTDGEVTLDGDTTRLVAVSEDTDINEIHASVSELDRDLRGTIEVQAQRASDRQNINRHIQLTIHTRFASDSLVYWEGEPVTDGPDTRFGEIRSEDSKNLIYTYTQADGSATIHVNEEPGFVERQVFNLRVWLPFDVPGLDTFSPATIGLGGLITSSGIIGIGLFTRRRNGGDVL